jgi:type I restriction enzyme M protein
MDLIPPSLIVARYFAEEQATIETLEAKHTTAESELEEFVEAHIGEDGLLADALNDSGNITASSVKARLKAIQGEPDSKDEREVLTSCAILIDIASKASRAVKKEQEALGGQVLAHYATLTEDEIKEIVVEDKWVASIQSRIENEVQRLTQALTERVQELEERYAQRLPDLAREVDEFSGTVAGHLKNMGVDWV